MDSNSGLYYFIAASHFWGTSETLPFAVKDVSGLWLSSVHRLGAAMHS